MRYLPALLLLLFPVTAQAETYWTDDFEAPCNLCEWTDYGLGHGGLTTTASEHTTGGQALDMLYPNGGFLDRFLPTVDDQFNVRFSIKLAPDYVVDSTASKIIYVRLDQSPGQYPNGVLEMMFGSKDLKFALQGAYDSSDTENIPLNITLSNEWQDIEFQWIMNTPGQANGSMTAWANGRQTASYTGRQYRGPTPDTTAADGINNGSNNYVTNVRNYSQFGTGHLYMDAYSVGNSRLGEDQGEDKTAPAAVTGLTVL